MLDARLALAGAITCPHPAARERASIAVQGRGGRWMVVCRTCSETMKTCARQWHDYSVRASTVYRRLRMLEYTRFDAARFVAQLAADRARVRFGLLSRGQVDV